MTDNNASNGTLGPAERSQNRRRLVVVGLLVAALFAGVFVEGAQSVESLVDIVQGLVTTAGILVAGGWAFYTFILGRSFAANVHIQLEPRQLIELENNKVAVISVKAKNIGRTQVLPTEVYFSVAAITDEELNKKPLTLIPTTRVRKRRTYRIFGDLLALEPEEETAEDVVVALGQYSKVQIQVFFSGGVRYALPGRRDVVDWTSYTILDVGMFQGKAEGER